jgi:hypothetical protein
MRESLSIGYVDESYGHTQQGESLYVLGVVEITGSFTEIREIMADLPRGRGGLVHFANEGEARRSALVKVVGQLPVRRTIVVRRGQDTAARARAVGLATLAWARRDMVDLLVIESRGAKPDRIDSDLLSNLRSQGSAIPCRFVRKRDDPLLWAADILASASFQALARGVSGYREALTPLDQVDC